MEAALILKFAGQSSPEAVAGEKVRTFTPAVCELLAREEDGDVMQFVDVDGVGERGRVGRGDALHVVGRRDGGRHGLGSGLGRQLEILYDAVEVRHVREERTIGALDGGG